jgi:hypothetical protein
MMHFPQARLTGLHAAAGARLREKWFLAVRHRTEPTGLPNDMGRFRIIAPPNGHSYADPFVIEWNRRHFVLFEDYSYAAGKGRIMYCEIFEDLSTSEPSVALERGYHVSYPFLWVSDGELYMLPETVERKALELYHAPAFPGQFELRRTLISDVCVIDPTLVSRDRKLWLFANDWPADGNPWDTLNLFWAGDLLGPWHPHPKNPVVRDVGSARPAGSLFEVDGQLVRPAQDSSVHYGREIVFKCVEQLDTADYREREVGRIKPDWMADNLATHTYNRDRRFEVVDGRWLTSENRFYDVVVGGLSRRLRRPTASGLRTLKSWRLAD